jgi:putative hydrolase of the HAD superfamily
MVIVFDMDDTLYDETTYVLSGFRAVARFLQDEHEIPQDESYAMMEQKLKGGRGRIFDDVLLHYGKHSKKLSQKCVSVYRTHAPTIQLDPEAVACLKRFADHPKYVVTDGNKVAQHNKVLALGLYRKVKHVYVTHRYGKHNAKPSPYCFLQICQRERVEPHEVVYIGDNPNKDFLNIKKLGFKTVRILKGSFRDLNMPEEYEADCRIHSLDELTLDLLRSL